MQQGRLLLAESLQRLHQLPEIASRHLLHHLSETRQIVVEVPPLRLTRHDQVAALEGFGTGWVLCGPVVQNLEKSGMLSAAQAGEFLLVA